MYKDPARHKQAVKEWYQKYREERLVQQKEYEKRNKEKIRATKKLWRHKPENILNLRALNLKRYHDNPEYRKRALQLAKEKRRKYREEIIFILGGHCKKCGFSDIRALQVDHINGGGRREFKENTKLTKAKTYLEHIKRNVEKYQLLCANCNWIKRLEANEIPYYN